MTDKTIVTARPKRSVMDLPVRSYVAGGRVEIELSQTPDGDGGRDLAADLYHAYYQPEVRFRPDDQIQGREVNKRLLEWMAEKKSFENLRSRTVGSIATSAMITGTMYNALTSDEAVQAALRKQEEVDRKREESQTAQNKAQALQSLLQNMTPQEGEGDPDPETQERIEKLQERIQDLQNQSQEAQGQSDQMAQSLSEDLDQLGQNPMFQAHLSGIQREGADEAKDLSDVLNQWGMGPGSPEARDPKLVGEVQSLLSDKIRQIAKIAGRMRSIAMTAKRGSTEPGVLPTEVNRTQDLSSSFIGEIAPLTEDSPEVLQAEKALQWSQGGLLGIKKTGEGKERGAFYALIDDSGSMGGTPEIVAKGMGLGIAQAAQAEEDRPYGLCTFSSGESALREVTSADSWRDHWTWAEYHYGGGTDIGQALLYGIKRIRDLSLDGYNPDFLLLSDGHGYVSPESIEAWNQFVEETGARLYYVPIGMSPQPEISELSTEIIPLNEMTEEGAEEVARRVGKHL